MLVAKQAVVYWVVQGKYRVGYTAFGTMVWAEEIVERGVAAKPEAPHIVVSQDTKTSYYFFKTIPAAKQRIKMVLSSTAYMDEVQLSCGCIHRARFMADGRRVAPTNGMAIHCVSHYDA